MDQVQRNFSDELKTLPFCLTCPCHLIVINTHFFHLNKKNAFERKELINIVADMSGNVTICDITDDVRQALKDFRFRKAQDTAALVLKVDREKQQIILDDKLEDTSIEALQDSLPSHQPRFVILSYKQEHTDGRVSFPLCFIFFTPRDSHAELQMMYAGSKIALQKESDVSRAYEIRELEDFTEDWLLSKLGN